MLSIRTCEVPMLAAGRVWFSGFVWPVSNAVRYARGTQAAFVVLFLGGMVIFPGSKLVSRFVFRRDDEPTPCLSRSTICGLTPIRAASVRCAHLLKRLASHKSPIIIPTSLRSHSDCEH